MHSRRPLPALALVMPHPQLPTCLSHLPANSPHTPRACTPSTPILFPKQLISSPRTSIDSWNSSNGNGDNDVHWEWKPEQMSLLVRTLDALPGHLYTPFNGPVPPSNLLDKIARSVAQAQGPLEWPHSIRATRAKLVEIARACDCKSRNKENMTIEEQDEDEVAPLPYKPKQPLYRQSSMDFLPSKDKGSGSLSRLSSRLQRTDRTISAYHPYPRPPSRSPSPPAASPRDSISNSYLPTTPVFAPSLPRPRPRTSSTSLSSLTGPPPTLRRSASTTSANSNPTSAPSVTLAVSPSKPGLSRRSESYSYTLPMHATLKRAPSFGASSIASAATPAPSSVSQKGKVAATEKQPQDPESDDEEKARQKKAKRPRTRSAPKKDVAPKKDAVNKPTSTTKGAKTRCTRSGSMFGAELPQPQPQPQLHPHRSSRPEPSSSSPPTKTLRRVKTTNFNMGPCLTARRISFGSLAVPPTAEDEIKKAEEGELSAGSALGSAFQLS